QITAELQIPPTRRPILETGVQVAFRLCSFQLSLPAQRRRCAASNGASPLRVGTSGLLCTATNAAQPTLPLCDVCIFTLHEIGNKTPQRFQRLNPRQGHAGNHRVPLTSTALMYLNAL